MDTLEKYLARQKPNNRTGTAAERRRLRDIAYERLKDAFRHANLAPGHPLSETALSRMLGISRTPVREALQQLTQEGLVQVIPGRAVTVAAPSLQGVMNVIHVRSLLEPEVARLVAESPTAGIVTDLRALLERMAEAARQNDRAAWSRADSEWHEALGGACPNALLAELVLQMRNRAHAVAVDTHVTQQRLVDCTDEHGQVVDAIAGRNPAAAEQAMRQHIAELRDSMFRRLSREG
jgi:DNA-binding GntR family transcriptional regulator